ncbi:Protein phosphatase 1 regulatory subunit 3A [Bagarius yarrelli]|uniref:Protein phosphatase 1 regulatory subunit 3A n=1 Tax=Bagarius yarrelli TaxID=175774 RepID=A0A556THB0_BAGYA|nr:Protein phosphatase 1 regulatory subunit 3A [Bagarius yarrelli]
MASYSTEPPTGSTWTQDEDKEEKEPKSLPRSSYDESDESETEPPLASVVRRKVSFADAFGLDLVSVKEFDNRVESAEGREKKKLYLSCFFSVPASDEELECRLRQNKLELERIELLPGSSTIRGTVRVLNLSYHKVIYVRTTLDDWQSHFDQLAEYVPGSSNGETDRFSFQLTLTPPFPLDGLRVEFCLCYESSTGIFWANNGGMNYVLFCYQKEERTVKEKEEEKENESEENNQKGKKSCLKTIINNIWGKHLINFKCKSDRCICCFFFLEQETSGSVKNKKDKTQHEAGNPSKNVFKESCKTLAERRNRQRAAQLASLQDIFSNREAEVQLVQPSNTEKSKTDLTMLLPEPQSDISVMTNISRTFQESKILPDQKNTLTLISPLPSDTNTSEVIGQTKMDVSENDKTEDMSKELSDDSWEDFLNGIDSLDNPKHNNALDQKCLLCTIGSNAIQQSNEESNVFNIEDKIRNSMDCVVTTENGSCQCFRATERQETDRVDGLLSYNCSEKGQISSKPHTFQESESPWGLRRPSGNEAQHCKQQVSERSSNEDEAILLPNQGETAYVKDATEQSNSKPDVTVLPEECTRCTSFADLKVETDTHKVVKDTMILPRIGNKPFRDSEESLERQQVDDFGEPMKKKEHIEEENKNRSGSQFSGEDSSVVQENILQEDANEPSHLKDRNTEIWMLSETSVEWDKAEPQKQAEYLDMEKIVAVCYESVREEFSKCSEKQRGELVPVENKESKNGLKTEDQGVYAQRKGEEDIAKKLHKLQNSMETCLHPPNLCSDSSISSPSGHFTCISSLSEGELLSPASYKGFEIEETLRYRVTQDLQNQGVGTEVPSSFSGTTSSSVSKLSSWLLVCLAKILNLSSFTGAIVCVILFVIFVSAYLHDLSVCLAIYLLSACWWCRQGMKKNVTKADSVD